MTIKNLDEVLQSKAFQIAKLQEDLYKLLQKQEEEKNIKLTLDWIANNALFLYPKPKEKRLVKRIFNNLKDRPKGWQFSPSVQVRSNNELKWKENKSSNSNSYFKL